MGAQARALSLERRRQWRMSELTVTWAGVATLDRFIRPVPTA